jgi:hypothetical protein
MSNGDIVVNLLLSPTELNFLQVAVDDLIDVQRSIIIDHVNQSHPLFDAFDDAVQRLRDGLELKQTLEIFNP